jgi:hypothetical protein
MRARDKDNAWVSADPCSSEMRVGNERNAWPEVDPLDALDWLLKHDFLKIHIPSKTTPSPAGTGEGKSARQWRTLLTRGMPCGEFQLARSATTAHCYGLDGRVKSGKRRPCSFAFSASTHQRQRR